MRDRFHSPVWYRMRDLKPTLAPQLEFAVHDYRGEAWVVLRNPFKGQVHRYPARLHQVVGALDGSHSLGEIFDAALARLGEEAPVQSEVVDLISALHRADLVAVPGLPPDLSEGMERLSRDRKSKRDKRWKNPLSVPVKLFDPDRLLDALAPLVRGRAAGLFWLVLWLAVVVPALALLPLHWRELTEGGARQWASLETLWQVALVYPVMKTLHELAHGLAVKRHGGEVHDCGLMFLVFYPVPYVDASAAGFFPSRRARMLVGAAGMLVELWLSALALLVWSTIEPGPLRDLCFAVMLIGGVSTLLVNGNPLLRFDGYHILADALGMPNLAAQSSKWWGWLLRNGLLRTRDDRGRARTGAEALAFALYGPLSLIYRTLVMLAIAGFVATQYFAVGMALAGWSIWQGYGAPLLRILGQFRRDPALAARRGRAGWMAGSALALLMAGLFLVPVPLWHNAEGVVWLPDDAYVRAGTDGHVIALAAADGAGIDSGVTVLRLENPEVQALRDEAAAGVAQARIATAAARLGDRSDYLIALERLAQREEQLARAEKRLAALAVTAPVAGLLSLPGAEGLAGRHLREGQVIGHVLPLEGAGRGTVRAVVPQPVAEEIGARLGAVQVLPVDGGVPLAAQLVRLVPGATTELPSPALGTPGGGRIAIDTSVSGGTRAYERVFVLDLAVPDLKQDRFGGRVLVKLSFGNEPLAYRMGRGMRRLLLTFFAEGG